MNNQENTSTRETSNQTPITGAVFWLGFCLLGAILYFALRIESEWTSEQIHEIMINSYIPTNKDFWSFLVLSVRFEVCFLLFLTLLPKQRSHIVLFCGRGLFFGFGGMDILSKTDFSCFFTVVVRQVLFISLFLYYDAFLCSERKHGHKNHMVLIGIVLLCELGVFLMIQFLFLYVLSKI